jgi:hypothetical protein
MLDLVIGYGEIGKAVKTAICPDAKIFDTARRNTRIGRVDVMHICFPYNKDFIKNVQGYIIQFQPKHIIVYSTVQIGTCKKIDRRVLHSPVEGKHPNLVDSIESAVRWIGYNDKEEIKFFEEYLLERQFYQRHIVKNTDHTEALKLLSTTEYGINIVFAGYKAQIAKKLKLPFELTKDWNEDYNILYDECLELPQYQKFILDAPEGPIGGHCIVPNAELLDSKFPNVFNKLIKEYGYGEDSSTRG